jgi:carboxypeptidase PM20D1
MTVLSIIIIALLLLLVIMMIRAAVFKPPLAEKSQSPARTVHFDLDKTANHLAAMIRCRTVLPEDDQRADSYQGYAEFVQFRQLLADFYPRVHRELEQEILCDHSLLYRWKGKSSNKPLVLMAHYDVVPAAESQWRYPPFDGVISDGVIWGRGALDTKSSLCGIFEAVEALLGEGFKPENDIYLAFGHDEETASTGAPAIVETLKSREVYPAMVLDEGGAIIEGIFPGVDLPTAVVGMAEKGVANIEFSLEGSGGHSSMPGKINPLGEMSKIILHLAGKPFPAHLPPEVRQMFNVLGRHTPFYLRIVFANLWCFEPLLLRLIPLFGRELNALCRSTAVFTMIEGSKAPNVIPDRVSAVANLRLAARDPLEEALQHLDKEARIAAKKAGTGKEPLSLEVKLLAGNNASPSADYRSPAYKIIEQTIEQTFHETLVTPYLMLGASDSRHYCKISENVLRFSPLQMNKEELDSIHGIDERITVEKLGKVVEFYLHLIDNYQALLN